MPKILASQQQSLDQQQQCQRRTGKQTQGVLSRSSPTTPEAKRELEKGSVHKSPHPREVACCPLPPPAFTTGTQGLYLYFWVLFILPSFIYTSMLMVQAWKSAGSVHWQLRAKPAVPWPSCWWQLMGICHSFFCMPLEYVACSHPYFTYSH